MRLWRGKTVAGDRAPRWGERGQALVIWAGAAAVIFGMLGLVLDGSNLQRNRRQLQNAADAAAFAGAYQLPTNPNQATTDSVQWLTKNGSGSTEVVTNSVSTTTVTNDTITVSLTRSVGYSVMKVLGLTSGSVTATAKVRVGTITSVAVNAAHFLPYAVWYQRKNGTAHQIGDIAIFRSNAWVMDNVFNPGGAGSSWVGKSKDFKGFLRTPNPVVKTGDITTKGGDACGQEQPYIDALNATYLARQPVILPMLNYETGDGIAYITVVTFVALNINISQNTYPFKCPFDFSGQIINLDTNAAGYQQNGGTPPPSSLACGPGIAACTPLLVQ